MVEKINNIDKSLLETVKETLEDQKVEYGKLIAKVRDSDNTEERALILNLATDMSNNIVAVEKKIKSGYYE